MRINTRRMRIVPWRELDTDAPAATLVMEWFDAAGKITRDERRQMSGEEFKELAKSVNAAALELIK